MRYLLNIFICFLCLIVLHPVFIYSAESSKRGLKLKPTKSVALSNSLNSSYRALLIGNNEYQFWDPLNTAVKDVEVLRDVLIENYGYLPDNVTVLKNATRNTILKRLRKLSKDSGPNDNVLIYYGGHGYYDEDNYGYWIPVDGRLPDDNDFGNYISNEDILNNLKKIKVKHKFLISDSCFSGSLLAATTRGFSGSIKKSSSSYYREKNNLISVQGLTSGGTEPVSDGGAQWNGHSIFAFHLIAQLKANQQPYLSATEIGERLVRTVSRDTKTYMGGAEQTPLIDRMSGDKDQEGEFFFLRPYKDEPVMVVYQQNEDEQFAQLTQQAQIVLRKSLIAGIERSALGALINPKKFSISAHNRENEIKELMKTQNINTALVFSLSASIERSTKSMMWQGMSKLNVFVYAYHLEKDRLILIKAPQILEQRYPIRRWVEDKDLQKQHLAKNASKVVKKWPKREMEQFFTEFMIQ